MGIPQGAGLLEEWIGFRGKPTIVGIRTCSSSAVTRYQNRYTSWTCQISPQALAGRACREAVLSLDEEDPAGDWARGPGIQTSRASQKRTRIPLPRMMLRQDRSPLNGARVVREI
jgi:hypothetical protein